MLSKPVIEYRQEQYYLAIRSSVAMKDIPAVLPALIPKVFDWLAKNNIAPDGPPFFRYLSMNKQYELVTEVGVPVKDRATGEGDIVAGSFPAGNYAIITYTGDYRHLKEAHMALESWITENGRSARQQMSEQGVEWGARTEFYPTDHEKEPNPDHWRTDIAFLLAVDKNG